MPRMSVTLEVSKLSGWLNADAPCGGSKGGACGEGRGMRDGRRAAAVQAASRKGLNCRFGGESAPRTFASWR